MAKTIEPLGEHWHAVPDHITSALPLGEQIAQIGLLTSDLLNGIEPQGDRRFDERSWLPQPSLSNSGVSRVRVHLHDEDAAYGSWQNSDDLGLVAPTDEGVLYIERNNTFPSTHQHRRVYQINMRNPENSVSFVWQEGEKPQVSELGFALSGLIYAIRRVRLTTRINDYDSRWRPTGIANFAHPDLQDRTTSSVVAASNVA